jgi:hypothetical protein
MNKITYFQNLKISMILTYLLTTCSRILLEKQIVSQIVKKSPAFYGTRRFITAFTSARHLYLPWARSIYMIQNKKWSRNYQTIYPVLNTIHETI